MPHGLEKSGNQEKSGKTEKNDESLEKSGKDRGFWKKSGKNLKKNQILLVQIY